MAEKGTFMGSGLQVNVHPGESDEKREPDNFSLPPDCQQTLRENDEDETNSYDSDETSKINLSWAFLKIFI